MESLILPESGTVYVDAQILIYTIEAFPVYLNILRPLWEASSAGKVQVATSELSVLEVLTGPMKTGKKDLIDAYEEFLTNTEIRLIPIDMSILKYAARLRAETSLRTPDALHAATAYNIGCEMLITNDLAFRSISSVKVQILKDIINT